jgi:3-dehydroquinate dehydratase-2
MKIKIINGPNLNLLGSREKSIYGEQTYQDLENLIRTFCQAQHIHVTFIQSNHEGVLIDEIQQSDDYNGIIINPGGYTHYSIAIRDAIAAIKTPVVEVHLSNIYLREDFRKVNVIKDVVSFSVVGKGFNGYIEAINHLQENYL